MGDLDYTNNGEEYVSCETKPFEGLEAIDERDSFKDVMLTMFRFCVNTDVIFQVEGKRIEAHRAILAVQSPVFNKLLLSGDFKESNDRSKTVVLPEKSAASFEIFLEFFYTRQVCVPELGLSAAVDIYIMSDEYQVQVLFKAISKRLSKAICMNTVYKIVEVTCLTGNTDLLERCHQFICFNAKPFLASENFCQLSLPTVVEVLSKDTLAAPELDILFAVARWQRANKSPDITRVFEQIRFELISLDGQSLITVAPIYELLLSNGVDLSAPTDSDQLPRLRLETSNMVIKKNLAGARVVREGDVLYPESLFWPASDEYTRCSKKGFIKVELAKLSLVDSMAVTVLQLHHHTTPPRHFDSYATSMRPGIRHRSDDELSTSFAISTSSDGKAWEDLASKTWEQPFKGRLVIFFRPRIVRYVKFIGRFDDNEMRFFCLKMFECPPEDRIIQAKHCRNLSGYDESIIVFSDDSSNCRDRIIYSDNRNHHFQMNNE